MNDIYESPKSVVGESNPDGKTRPGLILKILLVVFTLLSSFVSFLSQLFQSGMLANAIGGALGPLILGGLIVLIFQIGKGFRNRRSRYLIFTWCQAILFFSTSINFLSEIGRSISA